MLTEMKRVFRLELPAGKEILLDDPESKYSLEEVKRHFSILYPSISSGVVEEKGIMDGKILFSISGKKVGVKG